jgi:hypothetical protein
MNDCEYSIYYNVPGTSFYMDVNGSGNGFNWETEQWFALQPAPVVPSDWKANKVAIFAAPGSSDSCTGQGGIFNNYDDLINSELWGALNTPGGSGGSGGGSGSGGINLPKWLFYAGVVVGVLSGDNMRKRGANIGNVAGVGVGVYSIMKLLKK